MAGERYNSAMNMLAQSLEDLLRRPEPAVLVALQEALLAEVAPSVQRDGVLVLAGQFHRYLTELQSKLSARQYSELASWLDIAAVGLVAFEDILRGSAASWRDILIGMASEAAMVVGSRQYVKGWAVELGPIHSEATWFLREALWRLSEETQPDLAAAERLQAIRTALPASLASADHSAQAVVLGRLYQVLLLIRLSRLLST